jgi:hypothetical protein
LFFVVGDSPQERHCLILNLYIVFLLFLFSYPILTEQPPHVGEVSANFCG